MATLPLGPTQNFVLCAFWKFLATAFTKEVGTLLVNFLTISVVKYYIICTTTLEVKFNVVDLQLCENNCFLIACNFYYIKNDI